VSKHIKTLPPHYRWNFLVFTVDFVFFKIAFSFVDPNSVLPAFVCQFTDSAPLIGLVTTIYNGCWLLPQLLTARLINDKPRKKPYLLTGLVGRASFWVVALALWVGLARHSTAMLILFFACLGFFTASDGFTSVAWFDILARAIPLARRGRLLGMAQAIGGLAGTGVGVLIGLILDSPRLSFPANYALIFVLASVAFIPSIVALATMREPPPEGTCMETNSLARGGWSSPLRDPAFRRLMLCRVLIGMIALATPFYVVHASDVLHLSSRAIGSFVAAQTLAAVVAGPLLGLVSERWGPRYVIRIGGVGAAAAPLFALVTHLVKSGWMIQAYPFVYAALGFTQSSWILGFFNYLLEIAPTGRRPLYVGLGSTIMGALTLVPIVGGWLLEATSYTTLFGVTAALMLLGILFSLRLMPPSRVAPVEESL
jgi:MFS family permease